MDQWPTAARSVDVAGTLEDQNDPAHGLNQLLNSLPAIREEMAKLCKDVMKEANSLTLTMKRRQQPNT
eukprot:1589177-Prorocentrum_lima.AAC.1